MIGVFDSGFGGLTVLSALRKKLPQHDFVFLGDSARAPFGCKSHDTIYRYCCEAVDFLFGSGCELIIFACNSASAMALRQIQQQYLPKKYPDKRVLGVVIPVAEAVCERVRSGEKVGVVGTRATVGSGVWLREISKLNPEIAVVQKACPLWVPLIENSWSKKPETTMILKKDLHELKNQQVRALVLGCTHFPLLKDKIARIMGKNCEVFDTPEFVADKMADYLERHPEIDKKLRKNGGCQFFTTDDPAHVARMGEMFFGNGMLEFAGVELK